MWLVCSGAVLGSMAEKRDSPPSPRMRKRIVVVTASNDKQAAAVEVELAARRKSGAFGPDVLLFAVPDPSSARVGSGGATFNALATVQELVSASRTSGTAWYCAFTLAATRSECTRRALVAPSQLARSATGSAH